NDRGTSYDMYIQVQDALTAAVSELRDELSMEKFGIKFTDLSNEDYIDAIKSAIPVSISEAEPENIGDN
ncbi:MAG: biopolymer transporter ExbD, partial [Bacteroidales bacterium]